MNRCSEAKKFSLIHPSEMNEKVFLKNSIFDDRCRDELREISKHDIIARIGDILGGCPTNLNKAEEIFDTLKFHIANYIIHHEYDTTQGVSADLLLWLDSRINPGKAKTLSDFLSKYIKS